MKIVRYCPHCRTLELESVCSQCQGKTRTPEASDLVLVLSDVESNCNRLCTALCEQDIVFEKTTDQVSMSSVRSRGFGGHSCVFVAYKVYSKAVSIAEQLGLSVAGASGATVTPLPEDPPAKSSPSQPSDKKASPVQNGEEEEQVSPIERKIGRLLLLLSVVGAAVAVVFLSDWVIGLVKGLFSS